MGGVGGIFVGDGAQEGEDVVGDDGEHRGGVFVVRAGPARVLVGEAAGAADGVLALREDATGEGWFGRVA